MVAMRHTIWKEGTRTVHFYDGSLEAHDGVVDIPSDKEAWIRRAWILGYRNDPDTNEHVEIADFLNPDRADSAESVEEENKDDEKKTSSRRGRRSAS